MSGAHNHHHHHHGHHVNDRGVHDLGEREEFSRRLWFGIAINIIFVLIEAGFGFWEGSVALLADAGHNTTDIIGLVIALLSLSLAKYPAKGRFTYGLGSATILAALANALLLLVAAGAIAWEAIHRLGEYSPAISGYSVTLVALLAILVNGATAWMLHSGGKKDINIKAAYIHMLGDALISLGVVVSGLLIEWSGWNWIDPVTSLIIVAFIIYSTWGLLIDSIHRMLGAVPLHIDMKEVAQFLLTQTGVRDIHDLHIWSLSTQETALTVHLVVPEPSEGDSMLTEIARELNRKYKIDHSTFQIERGDEECPLRERHRA